MFQKEGIVKLLKWGGAALAILLVVVGLVAKRSPSAKAVVQAEPPPPSAPASSSDGSTEREVKGLLDEIDAANKHEAGTPAQDPQQPANPQAQQMQQMLAYQAMQRQAEMARAVPSAAEESGSKSYFTEFDDEDSKPKAGPVSQPVQRPQEDKPDSQGFACGSEENFWAACIQEGKVIHAVTTNELRGDFTGPVIAKVSQPFMSLDGKQILIPVQTDVIGESGRVEGQDQARLVLTFHRLILSAGSAYHPAGWSILLDKEQGLSIDGSAGQKGKVDNHIGQKILVAGAYGLLGGLSLYNTGSALTANGADLYRQSIASQMGQQGQQMLSRYMNKMPTITVPVGTECDVYMSRDLMVK